MYVYLVWQKNKKSKSNVIHPFDPIIVQFSPNCLWTFPAPFLLHRGSVSLSIKNKIKSKVNASAVWETCRGAAESDLSEIHPSAKLYILLYFYSFFLLPRWIYPFLFVILFFTFGSLKFPICLFGFEWLLNICNWILGSFPSYWFDPSCFLLLHYSLNNWKINQFASSDFFRFCNQVPICF